MKMIPRIQATQEQEPEARRVKSNIGFPYGDLKDAIEVVRKMFENNGQQHCTIHQLAAWLGHDSVTSGAFRLKLTTARTFGLIEFDHDTVKITELGRDIIDPNHERQAKVQAFLHVPLYQELFERNKGHMLPTDVGLEQEIVGLGVPPKQRDKARQAFQRSAQQAGFFEQGRTKLVLPSGSGMPIIANGSRDTRPLMPTSTTTESIPPQNNYGGGSGGGNKLSALQEQPLIQGLFQLLPPVVGTPMSETKRKEWLTLAENILKILYPDNQQG